MIALALSGGGARGIAHLGVLAALDELQIPVGELAGVSSGGIVAVFYAAGIPPREVLRRLQALRVGRLLRVAFSRYGLLHLAGVGAVLEQELGADCTFAQLRLPVTLGATDLLAGTTLWLKEGHVVPALLASSAVPILYRPMQYQGRQLVDGGLLQNLPVEPLRGQPGRPIVGVHCNPPNPEARITSFPALIERTLNLAIGANTLLSKQHCQLLLEPPELRRYRTMHYQRSQELFDIGYQYTLTQAPALRALLA